MEECLPVCLDMTFQSQLRLWRYAVEVKLFTEKVPGLFGALCIFLAKGLRR